MVDEVRAAWLDLLARAKFAKDGEQITETRQLLDEDFEDEQMASQFVDLVGDGLIEVA